MHLSLLFKVRPQLLQMISDSVEDLMGILEELKFNTMEHGGQFVTILGVKMMLLQPVGEYFMILHAYFKLPLYSMLNFTGAECYRTNAYFGRASSAVPIWMDRLLCNGREAYLDNCPFRGWGPSYHFCTSHRDDASVVCRNGKFL